MGGCDGRTLKTDDTKTCSKCKILTSKTHFYKDRKGKDGLRSQCKECFCKLTQAYKLKNKDKVREIARKYREANREKIRNLLRGWASRNRERIVQYRKAERMAKPLQVKERSQRHRKKYPVEIRERNRKWALLNADRYKLRMRTYREKNRERCFTQSRNYRARKLKAGGVHTKEQVASLYQRQKGYCICCRKALGKEYHIDHIFPLSKGGRNDILNIQLLCPNCNLSKHDRHPIEFMQSRGYLL